MPERVVHENYWIALWVGYSRSCYFLVVFPPKCNWLGTLFHFFLPFVPWLSSKSHDDDSSSSAFQTGNHPKFFKTRIRHRQFMNIQHWITQNDSNNSTKERMNVGPRKSRTTDWQVESEVLFPFVNHNVLDRDSRAKTKGFNWTG